MKKLFAVAAFAAGVMAAGAAGAATNLVTNGDFSAAGGFDTDYVYTAPGGNSMYPEGTWTIVSDPSTVHDQWVTIGGGNPLLVLNGATSGTNTAWAQEFAVGPGEYTFSFDAINICCKPGYTGDNAPSQLNFDYSFNGGSFVTLDSLLTNPASDAGFVYTRSGGFSIASAGTLRVRIQNVLFDAGGNDFAIDNISISAVPEPATWAMMILGFFGLGSALRSQRRRVAYAAI